MNSTKQIDQVATELLNVENKLYVRSQIVTLNANSMANPRVFVGVIPFYSWSKEQKVTYVITSRFLNSEMLVYENLLKGIEHVKTNDPGKAKKAVKNLLKKLSVARALSLICLLFLGAGFAF